MKKPRISDLPNLPSASLPICQVTDLENGDDDIKDDDDDDDDDADNGDNDNGDNDDDGDNLAKVALCFTPKLMGHHSAS